jgi:hypothetical protein
LQPVNHFNVKYRYGTVPLPMSEGSGSLYLRPQKARHPGAGRDPEWLIVAVSLYSTTLHPGYLFSSGSSGLGEHGYSPCPSAFINALGARSNLQLQ